MQAESGEWSGARELAELESAAERLERLRLARELAAGVAGATWAELQARARALERAEQALRQARARALLGSAHCSAERRRQAERSGRERALRALSPGAQAELERRWAARRAIGRAVELHQRRALA